MDEFIASDGEAKSTGLVIRDYSSRPSGYHACAPTFDTALIIPENEWASRLKDQQQANASLWDIREANAMTRWSRSTKMDLDCAGPSRPPKP